MSENIKGGELYRLEYLTTVGWVVGHAGLRLIDPQRYVDALSGRDVVARCVALDDRLQPSGVVAKPATVPEPHETAGKVPVTRVSECAACGQPHKERFECLL